MKDEPINKAVDTNPDPLTGAPGSHPVGTGLGSVGGAAAGAVLGSIGGPVEHANMYARCF